MTYRARNLLLLVMSLLVLQGAAFLMLKLLLGSPDLAHPVVHLLSGLAGLSLSRRPRSLLLYGLGFGVAYSLLGVLGALGVVRSQWLPLGPVDHAFHIALGVGIIGVSLSGLRARRTGRLAGHI